MFHQRENRWVFFLPSLPLLGRRVRNPCQPWVCSRWCDGGDWGEGGRARLLGPRAGGGGGHPLSPCPPACGPLWLLDLRAPMMSPFLPRLRVPSTTWDFPLPLFPPSSKAGPYPVPSSAAWDTRQLLRYLQTWADSPLAGASYPDLISASALPAELEAPTGRGLLHLFRSFIHPARESRIHSQLGVVGRREEHD